MVTVTDPQEDSDTASQMGVPEARQTAFNELGRRPNLLSFGGNLTRVSSAARPEPGHAFSRVHFPTEESMAQNQISSAALRFAGVVICALVLTGCGGGGDDAKAGVPLPVALAHMNSMMR